MGKLPAVDKRAAPASAVTLDGRLTKNTPQAGVTWLFEILAARPGKVAVRAAIVLSCPPKKGLEPANCPSPHNQSL